MIHLDSPRRFKKKRGFVLGPLEELIKRLKESAKKPSGPGKRRHLRMVKR